MYGILAFFIALVIMLAVVFAFEGEGLVSSIGGTLVPNHLDCAEDEIIGFTGEDEIGCVHQESLGR